MIVNGKNVLTSTKNAARAPESYGVGNVPLSWFFAMNPKIFSFDVWNKKLILLNACWDKIVFGKRFF